MSNPHREKTINSEEWMMQQQLFSVSNLFESNTSDGASHIIQGARRSDNGESVYLSDPKGYRFTAVLEFLPGYPRGNHAHQKRTEHFYVIEGQMKGIFWHADQPEDPHECVLKKGDWVTVYPGTFHRYEPDMRTLVVELSDLAYDAADCVKAGV